MKNCPAIIPSQLKKESWESPVRFARIDGVLPFEAMLSARRKSDRETVHAYFESKRNGPFTCLECGDEVILKSGRRSVNHFAHVNPLACRNGQGESDAHRRCKLEIFKALRELPHVCDVSLERPFGVVRPDVYAKINGVPVAIEVQLSALSLETITQRTIEYHRKGIYVLWLLQWTPKLNDSRYSPTLWEKWIHTAYFGNVYYWTEGLSIACYRFEPHLKTVPKTTWYSNRGKRTTAGGYSKRSKRFRTPVRCETLNLAKDFVPRERYWWGEREHKVPDAKLFMHTNWFHKESNERPTFMDLQNHHRRRV